MYLQESYYNVGVEHDLETFSQAVSSKDSNLWYEAMKAKMDSMVSNQVWDLVEVPISVKSIGCKWVFKTKKDSLGNLKRHKARLVANVFTQREGINYIETFSLVSRKDSLRVIIALVAHFDFELHQMDVKMTFLNGDLEEDLYKNFLLVKVIIWCASLSSMRSSLPLVLKRMSWIILYTIRLVGERYVILFYTWMRFCWLRMIWVLCMR